MVLYPSVCSQGSCLYYRSLPLRAWDPACKDEPAFTETVLAFDINQGTLTSDSFSRQLQRVQFLQGFSGNHGAASCQFPASCCVHSVNIATLGGSAWSSIQSFSQYHVAIASHIILVQEVKLHTADEIKDAERFCDKNGYTSFIPSCNKTSKQRNSAGTAIFVQHGCFVATPPKLFHYHCAPSCYRYQLRYPRQRWFGFCFGVSP